MLVINASTNITNRYSHSSQGQTLPIDWLGKYVCSFRTRSVPLPCQHETGQNLCVSHKFASVTSVVSIDLPRPFQR